MRIGIGGASGFVGKHLADYLTRHNHSVIPVGRGLLREESFQELVEIIEDCDILINLSGATVNQCWTRAHKKEIYNSRIETTARLVCAIKSARKKPKLMISTSAVGYYPSIGAYDEQNKVEAKGFLASLCRSWEAEALKCPSDTRLVIMRLGVVLALDGGALQQMVLPLLHTKISAVFGSGKQDFPWIAVQDVCRAVAFFIHHEEAKGVYNLVAPQQITQKYLAQVLAKAYRAWGTLAIPSFLFRCIFGERSSMLLEGQRVRPSRLLEAGFEYEVSTIEQLFDS